MNSDDAVERLAEILCTGCRVNGAPCSFDRLRARILLPKLEEFFLAHFNIFPRNANDD